MAQIIKSIKKDRTVGLIFGVMGFSLTIYLFLKLHSINPLTFGVGIAFSLTAFAMPNLLFPIRFVLEKIGYYMGFVNTYLLLAIIYVVFFIPIGKSYWIEKPMQKGGSMKYQF
jgi:glucan phosphoethanolaminetransferase (alkaline phosphatase superfamily)